MKTPTIKQILSAIDTAIENLDDGWDWAQDFASEDGERHVIDGPWQIEDLPDETARDAARRYEKEVEDIFFPDARQIADEARAYLRMGHLEYALDYIREAAHLESRTGDDVAMHAPLSLLEALIDAIDTVEPALRAVDEAWDANPYAEVLPGSTIWGTGQPYAGDSFDPGRALRLVLQDLPRETWKYAMAHANVDENLKEQATGASDAVIETIRSAGAETGKEVFDTTSWVANLDSEPQVPAKAAHFPPEAPGMDETRLTPNQVEVLETLEYLHDRPDQVSRQEGFATPLDFGAWNGSHHSATAARLVKRGLVERRKYHSFGREGSRGSCGYRISQAGRELLRNRRCED